MEKHVFANWSYGDLSYFLIALTLIELQITRIPGIEDYALGVLIHRAPVVHRLQQLFAEVFALELRMNPQQWQQVYLSLIHI